MVAVALDATVVEKQFILDRSLGGIDSVFSLNPEEFASMVQAIREVETSLGKVDYSVSEKDKNRRRSLYVAESIKVGEVITEQNVRSVPLGYGLHPKYLNEILWKKANRDLKKGERFALDRVE